jgi:D-glycero-D-manno-heptose 1,7-bisphosphate phosphatase
LVKAGIKKILFLIGYKGNLIKERYINLNGLKTTFSYSHEDTNTGKRILDAYNMLDDNFLLIYADNYWPIQLDFMIKNLNKKKAFISTTVFNNSGGTGEYGYENNVQVNSEGFVIKYDKTRKSDGLNGVDIGYFVVNKKLLDNTSKANLSFENDMIPKFIEKKNLAAFVTNAQYYYITDMKCVKKFENFVSLKKKKSLPSSYFKKIV